MQPARMNVSFHNYLCVYCCYEVHPVSEAFNLGMMADVVYYPAHLLFSAGLTVDQDFYLFSFGGSTQNGFSGTSPLIFNFSFFFCMNQFFSLVDLLFVSSMCLPSPSA